MYISLYKYKYKYEYKYKYKYKYIYIDRYAPILPPELFDLTPQPETPPRPQHQTKAPKPQRAQKWELQPYRPKTTETLNPNTP